MTPPDADRFASALIAVAEVFERELSDAAQTLYFDALRDLPLDACLAALEAAVRTKTFMPRPAEVRDLATGQPADLELVVEAAWLRYKELARHVGAYQSVTIDDAALVDTLRAVFGSWERACWLDLSPEMWAATRKEFGRVYRVMRDRAVTGPRTLDGFCDRENLAHGLIAGGESAQAIGAASLVRGYLPAALTTNARGVLDPVEEAHEAQRAIWRANVARAIATKQAHEADHQVAVDD